MKYDEEKLQRLRNRAIMLSNETRLLSEDVRQYRDQRNGAQQNLDNYKKSHHVDIFRPNEEKVEKSNQLHRLTTVLENAEKLLTEAKQNLGFVLKQAEEMGYLVNSLEDAIVHDWKLKLPDYQRLASASARTVGPEFRADTSTQGAAS